MNHHHHVASYDEVRVDVRCDHFPVRLNDDDDNWDNNDDDNDDEDDDDDGENSCWVVWRRQTS